MRSSLARSPESAGIAQSYRQTVSKTVQFTCKVAEMSDRYKWVALSNVTLGVLLATLDASIVLIAMPDIFRGIHLTRCSRATASTCSG